MFRLPDPEAALYAVSLMQRAVTERRRVEVSFLKRYSVGPHNGRTRVPRRARKRDGAVWFDDSLNGVFGERELLEASPTHWTVEPVLVDWTDQPRPVAWSCEWERAPYADVIKIGPSGPRARSVRLDRVIVRGGELVLTLGGPCRVRGTGLDPTVKRV